MATRTVQLTGSELSAQFNQLRSHIVRATLEVDDQVSVTASPAQTAPLSYDEFVRLLNDLTSHTVSASHVDDSREAIYTRMEGE